MNFFGLLTFNAPYLPWVLLGFSLLLGNSVSVDLLGEEIGDLLSHNSGYFDHFFRDGGRALLLLHGGHISSATRRLEDTKDSTLLEVITQSDLQIS